MRKSVMMVQKMQDFIEEHLAEGISLAELGQEVNVSPWYAHRLFRQETGYSPSDYIRRLRISKSALRLRDETVRITDVAFDMGFGSVDGYTRAFRREFGINPHEYAKNPIPISLFITYGVKFREMKKEPQKMEKTKNIFIQIVKKPERKVIIKRGIKAADYFDYCNEVGCDVWGMLVSMKSVSEEPVCLWLPEKFRATGTSSYVQGVEVGIDFDGVIPEGFDIITLPECEYLMFQGEPFPEEDFGEAIEAVQKSAENYVPSVIGYEWDKDNPKIQLEPIGTRGYIELHPVRKK